MSAESVYIPRKGRVLTGHRSAVYDLVEGEKDDLFYSVGGDGWIVQWDASGNGDEGKLIAQTDVQLFCALVLKSTGEMVAGDMNGHLYWLDLDNRHIVHRFTAHSKSIYAIMQVNDQYFVTASGDGALGIWHIGTKELQLKLQLSLQGLRSLSAHKDILYVGGSDNAIHIVDMSEWKMVDKISRAHKNSVFTLLATAEGLYSGGRDAHLKFRLWDHPGTTVADLPAHWFTINKIISLSPLPFLATASRDKTIRLWHPTCEPVVTMDMKMTGHTHSINTLLWLPERQKLFSAGDDRTIREFVWE